MPDSTSASSHTPVDTLHVPGAATPLSAEGFLVKTLALAQHLEPLHTAAHMGMFVWDPASDHLALAPTSVALLGILPGSAPQTSAALLELVHPEDRDTYRTMLQSAADGPGYQHEYRLIRPEDGQVIWIAEYARRTTHLETGTVFVQGLHRDSTNQKRTEAALCESETRLEQVLDIDAVGIFLLDPEGIIRTANRAFLTLTGYTPADVASGQLRWQTLTPPEWMAVSLEQMARLAQTGRIGPYEKEYLRRDGSRIWLLFAGTRLQDGTLAEFCIDITGRKHAEAALRDSEARFRELAEAVPDAVFTTTPEGIVEYVNGRREELTGHPPENAVGTSIWPELIHPEDRPAVEHLRDQAYAAHQPFETQYRLRQADGDYRWFMTRVRPIFDEGGNVARWFGTLSDVDALMRAEATLRQWNETLETRVAERTRQVEHLTVSLTLAEQQERQRVSQVLHDDLQQILYGLLMRLQRLQRKEAHQDSDTPLVSIIAQLQQAVTVTRTLVTELNPPILAREGVESALAWLADHMRERYALEVQVVVRSACEPRRAVRTLLVQMVREVLFNVVKHAHTNTARLVVEQVGEQLHVHIEDGGIGFDATSVLARTDRPGSYGLRSIAERLSLVDGALTIHATPGQGSRVTIIVPCNPSTDRDRVTA